MAEKGSLGSLSARFESKGDPGAIGYDSTGGYSYGSYQLAHNNAKRFVDQSPYAKEFQGISFNSPAFQAKWREIAKRDPQGFNASQHEFIKRTHFDPQANKLASMGLDIEYLPSALKDVIWSTAVQHGPNTPIIEQALRAVPATATEEDVIRKIYELRWSGGRGFANSTPAVKQSVYNRFFGKNGEMSLALERSRASSMA